MLDIAFSAQEIANRFLPFFSRDVRLRSLSTTNSPRRLRKTPGRLVSY